MKTPFDVVKGKIVDIDKAGIVTIQCHYDDWPTLLRREYKECLVQMVDSRPLSDKQRRTCYALIREIADYVGETTERTKEYMKLRFLAEDLGETADKIFSLSNAPMSLVYAFQRYLVEFIIAWDIPCKIPLWQFVDDIGDYVYNCLAHKKCCVCGKPAKLHLVWGGDINVGEEALPLCQDHKAEFIKTGQEKFSKKYHIDNGVKLDKALCKIYKA